MLVTKLQTCIPLPHLQREKHHTPYRRTKRNSSGARLKIRLLWHNRYVLQRACPFFDQLHWTSLQPTRHWPRNKVRRTHTVTSCHHTELLSAPRQDMCTERGTSHGSSYLLTLFRNTACFIINIPILKPHISATTNPKWMKLVPRERPWPSVSYDCR
jgi:hypothetical protein